MERWVRGMSTDGIGTLNAVEQLTTEPAEQGTALYIREASPTSAFWQVWGSTIASVVFMQLFKRGWDEAASRLNSYIPHVHGL